MQNCSCDIMGTCATTGQYYPILNTYLGQLEINVSGFPQGTEIPDLFVFFLMQCWMHTVGKSMDIILHVLIKDERVNKNYFEVTLFLLKGLVNENQFLIFTMESFLSFFALCPKRRLALILIVALRYIARVIISFTS